MQRSGNPSTMTLPKVLNRLGNKFKIIVENKLSLNQVQIKNLQSVFTVLITFL